MRGEQDDRQGRPRAADFLEQREAVLPRQANVADHHARGIDGNLHQGLLGRAHRADPKASRPQAHGQQAQNILVVIHDQHMRPVAVDRPPFGTSSIAPDAQLVAGRAAFARYRPDHQFFPAAQSLCAGSPSTASPCLIQIGFQLSDVPDSCRQAVGPKAAMQSRPGRWTSVRCRVAPAPCPDPAGPADGRAAWPAAPGYMAYVRYGDSTMRSRPSSARVIRESSW